MAASSRLPGTVLLILLVLAGVAGLWAANRPERAAVPGGTTEFADEAGTRPAAGVEVIRLRDAAKLRVVAQVVAGELDLFGAATHFRQINHEPPEFPQFGYRLLPGRTDEEKLCREVIMWVKFRPPTEVAHAQVVGVVAGLETALASYQSKEPATARKNPDAPAEAVPPTSG